MLAGGDRCGGGNGDVIASFAGDDWSRAIDVAESVARAAQAVVQLDVKDEVRVGVALVLAKGDSLAIRNVISVLEPVREIVVEGGEELRLSFEHIGLGICDQKKDGQTHNEIGYSESLEYM